MGVDGLGRFTEDDRREEDAAAVWVHEAFASEDADVPRRSLYNFLMAFACSMTFDGLR